jgi:hypothetical protein
MGRLSDDRRRGELEVRESEESLDGESEVCRDPRGLPVVSDNERLSEGEGTGEGGETARKT